MGYEYILGEGEGPKAPKMSEFDDFGCFGAHLGGRGVPQNYLTLKKYTILKSVFTDLPYDTGFVTL